MKFLCVCQGGNNRSASLSRILHDEHGQEAIPIGYQRVSEDSLIYFCEWADYIVAMTGEIARHIPRKFQDRIRVCDVGDDSYGTPYHPTLVNGLRPIVGEWALREFRI